MNRLKSTSNGFTLILKPCQDQISGNKILLICFLAGENPACLNQNSKDDTDDVISGPGQQFNTNSVLPLNLRASMDHMELIVGCRLYA